MQGMLALVCAGVAARHTWIQHLPEDQVPACGPGLGYIFQNFPLRDALELLFRGDGNCAIVDWTLVGLSIPEWVFICALALLGANFWQYWRRLSPS